VTEKKPISQKHVILKSKIKKIIEKSDKNRFFVTEDFYNITKINIQCM
jgi:hypothetical protein